MSGWLYLLGAILFGVTGSVLMKMSVVEKVTWFITVSIALQMLAYFCFGRAVKQLDMGLAYSIWSGAGVFLISGMGVVLFQEKFSMIKLACLLMLAFSIFGLFYDNSQSKLLDESSALPEAELQFSQSR